MIPEACHWSRPNEQDGSMFRGKEGSDPPSGFLHAPACHKGRRVRPITEPVSAQASGRLPRPMASVWTLPRLHRAFHQRTVRAGDHVTSALPSDSLKHR